MPVNSSWSSLHPSPAASLSPPGAAPPLCHGPFIPLSRRDVLSDCLPATALDSLWSFHFTAKSVGRALRSQRSGGKNDYCCGLPLHLLNPLQIYQKEVGKTASEMNPALSKLVTAQKSGTISTALLVATHTHRKSTLNGTVSWPTAG